MERRRGGYWLLRVTDFECAQRECNDPVDVLGWTGTLSTFGFMVGYGLVSAAAPIYLRRIGQLTATVVAVGAVGAVSMAIVFYSSWLPQTIPGGWFAPLTWPYNLLPYIFFAWMAIGLVWYQVVRVRAPEVAASIGSRFESPAAHQATPEPAPIGGGSRP